MKNPNKALLTATAGVAFIGATAVTASKMNTQDRLSRNPRYIAARAMQVKENAVARSRDEAFYAAHAAQAQQPAELQVVAPIEQTEQLFTDEQAA